MKRLLLLMFLICVSATSTAAIQLSKVDIEKRDAIEIYLNEDSEDARVAQSILVFEKYSLVDVNMMYYFGLANYESKTKLISLDKQKGIKLIEKAAVQGSKNANYEYAMILLKNDQMEKGLNYLKKAANNGQSNAQHRLGKMYYQGNGVPLNRKSGFLLIAEAAKKDEPNAQYDLAKIYFSQESFELQKQGVYWLKRAVVNKNYDACDNLYKLYHAGILAEQNIQLHIKYLKCSANNGNSDAIFTLASYYETGKYITKDVHGAGFWYQKLAKEKDPEASIKYAKYLFKFFPTKIEKVYEAMRYLESVSTSNMEAANMLGLIYKNGWYGISKNSKVAIANFEKAKNLGSETAQQEIVFLLNK